MCRRGFLERRIAREAAALLFAEKALDDVPDRRLARADGEQPRCVRECQFVRSVAERFIVLNERLPFGS